MFDYSCPGCGFQYTLKKRVTLTRRRCDHCGEKITPKKIDRQLAKAARRAENERLRLEKLAAEDEQRIEQQRRIDEEKRLVTQTEAAKEQSRHRATIVNAWL